MNSDDSYQKELEANREKIHEAEDQLKKGNAANGDEFINNAIKECQNNIDTQKTKIAQIKAEMARNNR